MDLNLEKELRENNKEKWKKFEKCCMIEFKLIYLYYSIEFVENKLLNLTPYESFTFDVFIEKKMIGYIVCMLYRWEFLDNSMPASTSHEFLSFSFAFAHIFFRQIKTNNMKNDEISNT